MFGINRSHPETHFRKPNEVCMELTKNGINDTNIKKLFRIFQITKPPNPLPDTQNSVRRRKNRIANVCREV